MDDKISNDNSETIYRIIGDKVTYVTKNKMERGIIKSIADENHVFVVYNCNDDWKSYRDYTAQKTNVNNLILGWI